MVVKFYALFCLNFKAEEAVRASLIGDDAVAVAAVLFASLKALRALRS